MGLSTHLGATADQVEQLASVVAWAYDETQDGAKRYLMRCGLDNVRVGQSDGRVSAGLVEIEMGQMFGGRSVPTLGIAGVAVAATARGAGQAYDLVREALLAARRRGVALSTLYPSTPMLYRKLGYEFAGTFCRSTLPLAFTPRALPEAGKVTIAELGESHVATVQALYRSVAQHRAGYLDRGPLMWDYVRVMNDKPARGFVALGANGVEGYAYVAQLSSGGTHHDLLLRDFAATTSPALNALLQFFARHSTTAENLIWNGGGADARLFSVLERTPKVEVKKHWMLRLVHVEAALRARGYPPIDARIELDVEDDVLPENTGRYAIAIERGKANVAKQPANTKHASARLTSGALATLYSGFVSAEELLTAGLVTADHDSIALLSAIFHGREPALADFF